MPTPTPDLAAREKLRAARPSLTARKATTVPADEKPLIEAVEERVDSDKPKLETPLVYKPGALVKPLTAFYETLGGFVLLGDRVCGQAIIDTAEDAAKSLDELARVNPKVRKVLMKMISGSATTKVVLAHLPIFMAILGHHFPKVLPYILQMFTGKPTE